MPVIALTALVGTSVFATLQSDAGPRVQITLGILSVAAAVLASLQTFLGYSERAEKHRVAGAKYGALARHLEELLAVSGEPQADAIEGIRGAIDSLALESPNTPLKIYRRAEGRVKELL